MEPYGLASCGQAVCFVVLTKRSEPAIRVLECRMSMLLSFGYKKKSRHGQSVPFVLFRISPDYHVCVRSCDGGVFKDGFYRVILVCTFQHGQQVVEKFSFHEFLAEVVLSPCEHASVKPVHVFFEHDAGIAGKGLVSDVSSRFKVMLFGHTGSMSSLFLRCSMSSPFRKANRW